MFERINGAIALPDRYTPVNFYKTFRTSYPTILKLITTIKLLDEHLERTEKPLLLGDSNQDRRYALYVHRSVTPISQDPTPKIMELVAGFRYAVQEYRSDPLTWNEEIAKARAKGIPLPRAL